MERAATMKHWVAIGLAIPFLLLAITCCQPTEAQAKALSRTNSTSTKKLRRCWRTAASIATAKPNGGGLDLTNRKSALEGGDSGEALVPGKSKASLVWKHIQSGKMPPKKPLTAAEKLLIEQWIDGGAVWGSDPIDPFRFTTDHRAGLDWWALQPVPRPPLPRLKRPTGRTALTISCWRNWKPRDCRRLREADRPTLIRRLYFDLIGLLLVLEKVAAFVADKSPDAYEKLVDSLLASPHHGERWARHWLDVVRFGEVTALNTMGALRQRLALPRLGHPGTQSGYAV